MTVQADAHLVGAYDPLTKGHILDLAPFKVYVQEIQTYHVVYANCGHAPEGMPGASKCHQLIYGEERPCLSCKVTELMDPVGKPNGRVITSERFNEVEDCWYQLREGALILSNGLTAMYSIAIDISEVKKMQNELAEAHAALALTNLQLERLTVTDPLTGLFNRRKFDEVLSQECERALRTQLPMTVILADIDHFKSVNDLYGHPIGDKVLVKVAEILRQSVRKVDTVARWGGEEFMVLCPATHLDGGCAVADNIRAALDQYDFPVAGRKTCSFGVAEHRCGDAPQAVVKRADEALYRAKNGGRNQVCVG